MRIKEKKMKVNKYCFLIMFFLGVWFYQISFSINVVLASDLQRIILMIMITIQYIRIIRWYPMRHWRFCWITECLLSPGIHHLEPSGGELQKSHGSHVAPLWSWPGRVVIGMVFYFLLIFLILRFCMGAFRERRACTKKFDHPPRLFRRDRHRHMQRGKYCLLWQHLTLRLPRLDALTISGCSPTVLVVLRIL